MVVPFGLDDDHVAVTAPAASINHCAASGVPAGATDLTAHLLLGALRADVVAELLAAGQPPPTSTGV